MPAPGFDHAAMVVQRLAVLTAAGIAPVSAWRHVVAASGSASPELVRAVDGLASAHEIPGRLAGLARTSPAEQTSAWAALATVWAIAAESGAALGPALERSASVLRDLTQSAREVEVALAGPVATARVVLALPGLGLLLGALLGFDVLGALVTVPGAVCLVVGGLLIAVAVRWNRRLVRAARDVDATPGLGCELMAIAVAGGSSIEKATVLVVATCREVGLPPPDGLDEVLAFARRAGAPVGGMLRAEADEERRSARAAAAQRAARLETRMLLPLGLCVLPAFVALGVGPIAVAILSSTALVT